MQSQATVSRARKLSAAATPTSTICHAVSSAPGEVSSITVGAVSLVCSTLSSSEVVLSGLASISSSSLVPSTSTPELAAKVIPQYRGKFSGEETFCAFRSGVIDIT